MNFKIHVNVIPDNLLYIGAQDDMCMCYPTLPDEDNTLGENDNFENKNFTNFFITPPYIEKFISEKH